MVIYMKINKIAAFLVIPILLVTLWIWAGPSSVMAVSQIKADIGDLESIELPYEGGRPMPKIVHVPDQPPGNVSTKMAMTPEGGIYIDYPWQENAIGSEPTLPPPVRSDIEFITSIALTDDSLGQAQPGDVVNLSLPDGRVLQTRVTHRELQAGGRCTWQGEVEVGDTTYPVNFTFGKETVFGLIGTPEGSFTLETLQGRGWIYMTPPSNGDHPDELVPRS